MAEGGESLPPSLKLFRYEKPPPKKGEDTLGWLLDINEEYFKQELASVVSMLFSFLLVLILISSINLTKT